MSLIEVQQQPFIGEFNTNVLFQDASERFLLQRNPNENMRIMRSIYYEYREIGFTQTGGRFRRRSITEQEQLTKKASDLGLRVLPPFPADDKHLYYRFLENAQTLDQFLPQASETDAQNIVLQMFDDLRSAHHQGIVYGDRWSRNMLTVPFKGLIHIDFDLEISGVYAREFEVAQAAYYALSGGREKIIGVLAAILGSPGGWFNHALVNRFLCGHAKYFFETKYGHIQDETDLLIELAEKRRAKRL